MTDVTAQAAPDPSIPEAVLGRRALERLDLLLLTVESLDLNGGEAMLWATRQLGFETIFPNLIFPNISLYFPFKQPSKQ